MVEYFETFDDDGRPSGTVARPEVHRRGLWHYSVNVFLFHGDGRLWLQRRAASKDVWPNAWDLSVGEHVQPGERLEQAALRGLDEELSVRGVALTPWGPLLRHATIDPARDIHDREFQQCFRGVYDGEPEPDPGEVAGLWLADPVELHPLMRDRPQRFTPWFRHCAAVLWRSSG